MDIFTSQTDLIGLDALVEIPASIVGSFNRSCKMAPKHKNRQPHIGTCHILLVIGRETRMQCKSAQLSASKPYRWITEIIGNVLMTNSHDFKQKLVFSRQKNENVAINLSFMVDE